MSHDTWGLPQPLLMGKVPAGMYSFFAPRLVSESIEVLRYDTSGLYLPYRQHEDVMRLNVCRMLVASP